MPEVDWSLERATRIATELNDVGIKAWAEEWRSDPSDDPEITLNLKAPIGLVVPVRAISVWHDGEEWRVDTMDADQTNTDGTRGFGNKADLTDAQIAGLLLEEAGDAWQVVE